MAPGTFANSTQRTQCGGAAHAQEGSRRLMKIQLAHFGNGLCKRNEISGTMVGNKSREVSAPLDPLYICCYILAANKGSPSGRQRHL